MDIKKKISKADLEKKTEDFLSLHWNNKVLRVLTAKWESYYFKGSIPNQDKQGCYALGREDQIIYIGVGASHKEGLYKEYGIGSRLSSHVIKWDRTIPSNHIEDRVYKPRERWKGVTEIYTFGLPSNYGYLALALEAFLISELKPESNVTRTR